MDRYLTTGEAAIKFGVTRQAIYLAIKKNRLKAKRRIPWCYQIKESDLDEYRKSKFCRDMSTFDDKPLYDEKIGEYSLKKAAEYVNMDYHTFYFHLMNGKVKGCRRGAAWIFQKIDLDNFCEQYNVTKNMTQCEI